MKRDRKTVDQLYNDPSFIRWIEGEADHREAEKWNEWVQKSEQNRSIAIEAQQKILGITFKEPELPNVSLEWNKIRHDIKQKKSTVTKFKVGQHNFEPISIFFKVAAVLLVGAFVGFAAYMSQESNQVKQEVAVHTVTTDYGETKTLNLSDGSQIILAANSQLSYKENWLEQPTKRLSLEGEAFFAVAPKKAKSHPKLEVETEDGTASVWGTRFTVDTYVEGTRVVLEEGEVEVRTIKDKRMTMNPGEMATFQKESSEIQLQKVNPRVYTSWSTNELFFDDTPLSVLVNRIERTYGVKVKVQNSEVLKKKLSGSVDFKSLNSLTSAVATIFDIQIERSEGTVFINDNTEK